MSNQANIDQIVSVAEQLKELKDEVVFVGGSTTALLVDNVAAGRARQTKDVDFIVDISVRGDYWRFEEKMRNLGFANDQSEDAPMCRWVMDYLGSKLKVDAMPVEEDILGFSNQWYKESIDTSWEKEIKPGLSIRVVDPVYFLGTKFEAFNGRGNNDVYSHDLEDVIYVLEHRTGIEMLVYAAAGGIKSYLSQEFKELLVHPDLENTLPGLLDDGTAVDSVTQKIRFIAEKCKN